MDLWLFVPGNRADRIGKALDSDADRVLVDWEDGVGADDKAEARRVTGEALADLEPERCAVRVNAAETQWHAEDLRAVERIGPGAVMVAKPRGPEDLAPLADAGLAVVPLIESPLGVERAFEIAGAPGVRAVALGYIDYLTEIGGTWGRESLLYARGRLVNAARAAGVGCLLDGVYSDIEDDAGLIDEAAHALSLGFTGKLVVHPRQIAALREHGRPTDAERAEAEEILRVYREAVARGEGAVRHKGRLIDAAHAREAERLLERAATFDGHE